MKNYTYIYIYIQLNLGTTFHSFTFSCRNIFVCKNTQYIEYCFASLRNTEFSIYIVSVIVVVSAYPAVCGIQREANKKKKVRLKIF